MYLYGIFGHSSTFGKVPTGVQFTIIVLSCIIFLLISSYNIVLELGFLETIVGFTLNLQVHE